MQTLQSTSHDELRKRFWSSFREILELLVSKEDIYIGLSGGSSLDIFYSHIREHFAEIPETIRKKVRFVFLDERVVPVEHPDSNEWQLRAKFLDEIVEEWLIEDWQIIGISSFLVPVIPAKAGIQNSKTLDSVINTEWQILGEFVRDTYSQLVLHIDIALFWVGPDGHIASLFPHHPLLSSLANTYLEITDSPKPPAHRITVSPEMIRDIPYIFVAIMRGKEEVFHRLLDSRVSMEDCPVNMLQHCKELVVMSDIDE
jgi:6-phosphogluconolactonase